MRCLTRWFSRAPSARSPKRVGDHLPLPLLRVAEQAAERDVVRQGAVVDEHRDLAIPGQPDECRRTVRGRLLHLVRREHGEPDARFGEHHQRLGVHRGLREPEARGLPPEALPEVLDAPAHLGALVGEGAEGEDDVVIGRGDRIALTEPFDAEPVAMEHRPVCLGRIALEPREQRRAGVEAQEVVGVDAGRVRLGADRNRGERGITLPRDARVPVVIRRGRRLAIDLPRPGVLARRLVEVCVHDDRRPRAHPSTPAIASVTFGNRSSRVWSTSARRTPSSSEPPGFSVASSCSRSEQ